MSQTKTPSRKGRTGVGNALLHQLPIPAFAFDEKGRIQYWSSPMAVLSDRPESDLLDQEVVTALPFGEEAMKAAAEGRSLRLCTTEWPGSLPASSPTHTVIIEPACDGEGKAVGGWVVFQEDDSGEAQQLLSEILRIVESIKEGELDVRGRTQGLNGVWAEALEAVNGGVDALVDPLRLAAGVIREISIGEIPDFVIQEYKGEFHEIKQNVNTFLATMYGMHHETRNLVAAIQAGKLHTRGNDWDFEGNWAELVQGVNRILDAVVEPVQEAGGVLARLADFDLRCRVEGKYKGDHAQIKKALNSTISSLNDAMGQVAGMAAEVAAVGEQIAAGSENVTAGADEQAGSISEASAKLDRIGVSTRQNAKSTDEAQALSMVAREAVSKAKEATDQMVAAMEQIRESAEDTIDIIEEINGITEQTNELATKAATQATKVGESARGFDVVAKEVRTLSQGTRDATVALEEMTRSLARIAEKDNSKENSEGATELSQIAASVLSTIQNYTRISMQAKMLAVNASVEAAHVGEAGLGFEKVAATVRDLAAVSMRSSEKSNILIRKTVDLSREGEGFSKDIGEELIGAVEAVGTVAKLVSEVAEANREQTQSIEALNQNMNVVNGVTQKNAVSAKESSKVAAELVDQANRLNVMVGRFQLVPLHGNGASPPA